MSVLSVKKEIVMAKSLLLGVLIGALYLSLSLPSVEGEPTYPMDTVWGWIDTDRAISHLRTSSELDPEDFDQVFLANRAIAHALGGINGEDGINTLESLEHNLQRGFRMFEVDLTLTEDGSALFGFHDGAEHHLSWSDEDRSGVPTHFDEYHILSAEELIRCIAPLPDVYLVLDMSSAFEPSLRKLVETVESVDPKMLRRIIPQIYTFEHLAIVRSIAPFERVILTLYRMNGFQESEVVGWVRENEIGAVTMWADLVNPEFSARLRDAGAVVYGHTVNTPEWVIRTLSNGGYGIYTDTNTSLLP